MAELSVLNVWEGTSGTGASPTSDDATDKQLLSIWRDGSTTPPTVASGNGWSSAGTTSGNACSSQVYTRTPPSDGAATGTTTNQTNKIGVTLRDVLNFGTYVGGGTSGDSSGVGPSLPAVPLPSLAAGEGCKILYGVMRRSATNVGDAVPAGLTRLEQVGSGGSQSTHAMFITTDYVTANQAAIAITADGTGRWTSWAIPIIGAIPVLDDTDDMFLIT